MFGGSDGDDVARRTPTPTTTPTEEGPIVIVTPEEETTPTPTRVVSDQTATPTPTEPAVEAGPANTATTAPVPTATSQAAASRFSVPIDGSEPGAVTANVLKNGDFEAGFGDNGVAIQWEPFKNDAVTAHYSRDTFPYVVDGSSAQRISVADAARNDRYAGIYQQVDVIPNQVYTLELHGQIRSGLGDVSLSSYGYRMQYAISLAGGTHWQDIPNENWVELPWDEQMLNSPNTNFVDYSTEIKSTNNKLTVFVRAWNKWADPGLAEYTLDDLSLVGPTPGSVTRPDTKEPMIDQPLPVTGTGDPASFTSDGRFWGAMLILLLLASGAIYRGRWEH
jgi:hypothetical protein